MAEDEKVVAASRLEEAHALLAEGKRDEALEIAEELIKKDPRNFSAQAVRDRIYTEENRVRLATETEADREEGDESPIVPRLMLLLGIACVIGATVLVIKFVRLGLRYGFSTEITGRTLLNPGAGKYPVHLYFMYPAAMFIISGICFYGYRRYMRRR